MHQIRVHKQNYNFMLYYTKLMTLGFLAVLSLGAGSVSHTEPKSHLEEQKTWVSKLDENTTCRKPISLALQ